MKTKNIILILLCFFILAALAPVNIMAEQDIPHDAKSSYDFLKAIGVTDNSDVSFDGDATVSRAYFVKLALGLSNEKPSSEAKHVGIFPDVTKDTAYFSYIEKAKNLGYIGGNADASFSPDNAITYEQSLKILVGILGYTHLAEVKGGYPIGYITVAKDIGLTKGISISTEAALNQNTAMYLLENAANTDIMQISSIGDSTEYETRGGITLLSQRHKIEKTEGVVEATAYTDLIAQNSGLLYGEFMLDKTVFHQGDTNAYELLGQKSELYYDASKKTGVKKAIYIKPTDDNLIYTCYDPKNLEKDGNGFKHYTDGSNSKRIRLSSYPSVILNGKMAVYDISELPEVHGSINFISNDGDGVFDVVLVNDYQVYVASGVSASGNIVTTKDGTKIELDPQNDDYKFVIKDKDGKELSFDKIKEDTVILMASTVGDGLHKKELIISNEKLEGTLSEIGNDNVVINSKSYELNMANSFNAKLGGSYTYLVDANGRIAYVYSDNDIVYGFLWGVMNGEGLNNNIIARIFTENNRWVELNLRDNLEFNGKRIKAQNIYDDDKLGASFDTQRQIIRYNVNKDAEIIRIETAQTVLIDSVNEETAIENDTFRISYKPSGTVPYRANSATIDGKIFVDNNTKIFVVPTDFLPENFDVIPRGELVADRWYPNLVAYDADRSLTVGAIRLDANVKTIGASSKFMVVKSKGTKSNADGDIVPSIRGFWNGSELAFPVKLSDDLTADKVNSIQEGDIILFRYDETGSIDNIEKYTYDGNTYYKPSTLYQSFNVIGGVVGSADNASRRLKLYYTEDGEYGAFMINSSAAVTIYNSESKTVSIGSLSDISSGDRLIAKMSYFVMSELIIVR